MSKRKSSAPSSRKSPKRKPAPLSVRAGVVDCASRWRAETDGIKSALADAPPLDRDVLSRELYPYNDVASSEPMRKALLRIVERRDPETPWLDVFCALERADRTGHAGAEYAMRSLPSWWSALNSLRDDQRGALAVIIERSARLISEDEQGGAR